jgi:hypothetical protein
VQILCVPVVVHQRGGHRHLRPANDHFVIRHIAGTHARDWQCKRWTASGATPGRTSPRPCRSRSSCARTRTPGPGGHDPAEDRHQAHVCQGLRCEDQGGRYGSSPWPLAPAEPAELLAIVLEFADGCCYASPRMRVQSGSTWRGDPIGRLLELPEALQAPARHAHGRQALPLPGRREVEVAALLRAVSLREPRTAEDQRNRA